MAQNIIAVSFDMPEKMIANYLKQAKFHGNTFVYIKGVPKGEKIEWLFVDFIPRFKEKFKFSIDTIRLLKINPDFFNQHKINFVPFFLIEKKQKKYLLRGTFSLDYAKSVAQNYEKK